MQSIRRIFKPVSYVVSAGILALSLHVPMAQAALVRTEVITAAAQAQENRDQLKSMLSRQEVRDALLARGVDPAEVQARIAALTDDEVQQLAAKVDELPAGGSALGVIALVFIVLIILDLTCLTDIFPFIKKNHCKR